jgi:hypothetical protein
MQLGLILMMHVRLPDRAIITLCEAVTAFVYGESRAASSGPFYPSDASDALLGCLLEAAHAGRVGFHALPAVGGNKYQKIDPLYFDTGCRFNWNQNQLLNYGTVDEQECKPIYDGQEYDEVLGIDWCDVHIDRAQFASFLREMGVTVLQNLDPGALQNVDAEAPADLSDLETSGTGLAGRPRSVQFVLPMAKKRLDAKDYPDSKTEFAKQLAKDFAEAAPKAHHPKPNSIRNNPEFSEMWRRKPRKDPS